jgi:putative DNA primase/helicase
VGVRYLGAVDTPYHRLVGRFFLINLVRRVYEPGCIMRSVPVLEGAQDKGKSTALRLLAQPWFSDTPFKVGDKDSYQQIQGVMVYEISELESFTRAEATAVKAFVSSTEDNFRAPYERQNEKHPRQTVFAATTNAVEYLKDWTGNTRFWPLACGQEIDLDGLADAREQLLAEALALYRHGERTYPTAAQQVGPVQARAGAPNDGAPLAGHHHRHARARCRLEVPAHGHGARGHAERAEDRPGPHQSTRQ